MSLTIQPQTLMKNVDKILESPNFRALLHHQGISINEWSAPKQTDTTQGWRVSLRVEGQTIAVPTKIEFSRRAANLSGALVEFVPSEITAAYKMQPVLLRHYSVKKAVEQKLAALQGRVESQARDVIDLKFLEDLLPGGLLDLKLSEKQKHQCSEVLLSIGYDDFMSQVWPYILVEYQGHYKSRAIWGAIQDEVLSFIKSLKVSS